MNTTGTSFYEKWQKHQRRRTRFIILGIAAGLLVLALVPQTLKLLPTSTHPKTSEEKSPSSSQQTGQFTSAAPDYPTLTPDHKQMNWQRSVLPSGSTAYVYTDTVSGIPITVNEQPLPPTLASDPVQLEEIAKGYHATRFITVEGTKVFIGMPLKGVQAVLFSKSNLLILIKSTAVLNDEQWRVYVQSLK